MRRAAALPFVLVGYGLFYLMYAVLFVAALISRESAERALERMS
jgi:hypothetical protein